MCWNCSFNLRFCCGLVALRKFWDCVCDDACTVLHAVLLAGREATQSGELGASLLADIDAEANP
jgi:hypothetical protein